jgi:hypothetical protein
VSRHHHVLVYIFLSVFQASSVKSPLTHPASSGQDPLSRPRANFKVMRTFYHSPRPEYAPSPSNSTVKLPQSWDTPFTGRSDGSVTFSALLQRLKARFPTAWGPSGHRLFISAFMLTSCISPIDMDETYDLSVVYLPYSKLKCRI